MASNPQDNRAFLVPLTPAVSSYLDMLRFAAALLVVIGHMNVDGFAMGPLAGLNLAHEAVMVFFVLSGFIITHTTLSRRSDSRQFIIARVSRIYCVALPAIVFSVLCAWAAAAVLQIPAGALSNQGSTALWRLASSALFLDESWFVRNALTLNAPYWSLNYEVWYYAAFGVWVFMRGLARVAALCLCAILTGPAIILMYPIWVLGGLIARYGHRISMKGSAAALVIVSSAALIWLISATGFDAFIRETLRSAVPQLYHLRSAQRFVTDYMIAVLVAANIIAFMNLRGQAALFFATCRPVWSSLAGFSFTLYLFHRPLTQIAGHFVDAPQQTAAHNTPLVSFGILLAILMLSWALSHVTEGQRGRWRARLQALWPATHSH